MKSDKKKNKSKKRTHKKCENGVLVLIFDQPVLNLSKYALLHPTYILIQYPEKSPFKFIIHPLS